MIAREIVSKQAFSPILPTVEPITAQAVSRAMIEKHTSIVTE